MFVFNLNNYFFSSSSFSNVSEAKGNLRCIKSFTETCLKGMQRQSASLLAKGVSNNVRNLCKTINGKKRAMRTSRCAKRFTNELRMMMNDFANDYRDVNEMESKEKVTGLCCGYHRFIKRLNDQSSTVCSPTGVESLKNYIDNISGDIMGLFCSSYTANSPQCIALLTKNLNRVSSSSGTSTFIPPLLIAVENF